MGTLWLKIKVWTKIAVFSFLTLYILIFVVKNGDRDAKFWYWFGKDYQVPLLFLVFFAFLVGVIGTILVRTTFKTVGQFKEMRHRARTEKLEQQVADMTMKASMLQTRPSASAIPTSTTDTSASWSSSPGSSSAPVEPVDRDRVP